jgi:hypothetical protein
MRNLANIIADLETQRASVTDLEQKLAAARARGSQLLKEFSQAQSSLTSAFGGNSGSASKATRKPREAAANYWTSATRVINNCIASKMPVKSAIAAAKAAVAKLAKKKDSVAPPEVLENLEARVKELYAVKPAKAKTAKK